MEEEREKILKMLERAAAASATALKIFNEELTNPVKPVKLAEVYFNLGVAKANLEIADMFLRIALERMGFTVKQ